MGFFCLFACFILALCSTSTNGCLLQGPLCMPSGSFWDQGKNTWELQVLWGNRIPYKKIPTFLLPVVINFYRLESEAHRCGYW